MKALVTLPFFVFLTALQSFSQNPVNCFAAITAISGTTLTLASVNETYDTFEDGESVMVMQMQDNVLGTNTTNAVSFGNIASIQSAGLYEVAQILSHTESGGVPTSVVLSGPLVNIYSTNINARVQLISLRNLGTNFTSTANIVTVAWNGTVGGVTAVWVPGVFTLGHSISANGAGFQPRTLLNNSSLTCQVSPPYFSGPGIVYGEKGEGIYRPLAVNPFTGARGKLANAGGGGNISNAGGGGGGNYTAGGNGGVGWSASPTGCNPPAGGIGGLALSAYINFDRVFMGGSGGNGQANNAAGTAGAAGGGIVYIKTHTLVTTSCSGLSVTANGKSVTALAGEDGAGGGGAGGSVLFNVGSFSVSSSCTLLASANGGAGGSAGLVGATSTGVYTASPMGGGGGGGQGVVLYAGPQPTVNVSSITHAGTGGPSCLACGPAVNGTSGGGAPNAGVLGGMGLLPIELLQFSGFFSDLQQTQLNWSTGVEKDAEGFVVERMGADDAVRVLGTVGARGSYSSYNFTDPTPDPGTNYYRLRRMDRDGSMELSHWIHVQAGYGALVQRIFPSPVPAGQSLWMECNALRPLQVRLVDLQGQLLMNETRVPDESAFLELPTTQLPPGVYLLELREGTRVQHHKLVLVR